MALQQITRYVLYVDAGQGSAAVRETRADILSAVGRSVMHTTICIPKLECLRNGQPHMNDQGKD